MNPPVLVDTSCWVEYFNRPEGEISGRVRALVREDRAAISGIVLSELLQGARTAEEASELRLALEAAIWIEADREVYMRAGELGAELRRSRTTVPVTDCIIAAAAESAGASVFTLDSHFREISQASSVEIEGD